MPHIVTRGSNDGIPLIFLHGNGVDHRSLLWLDTCFAQTLTPATGVTKTWKRIYVDLPGFGGTPALSNTGGLRELDEWANEFVQETVGGQSFGIVGNSLGGLLARSVASRHPQQLTGMALLAPVIDPVHKHRRLGVHEVVEVDEDFMLNLRGTQSVSSGIDDFCGIQSVHTAQTWNRYQTAILPGIEAADSGALERLDAHYTLNPLPEEPARVGMTSPVLIVTGRQDQVVGYEDQQQLLKYYPHASYVVLDGAGHNVHIDQEEVATMLLGKWSRSALSSCTGI